ncbi:MAG: TetR/AcrR family transcriptional regulator [Clostridia bacterium]|nr:TetR/AcrR family transcriptional regulator [Clostridia bacterium]
MEYATEDYTRHYIMQALFKLMSANEYEKISVKDIVEKAGVGRATFYRYFKSKEDVLIYYLEHNAKKFIFSQRFFPRCKDDHIKTVTSVLTMFKENIEPFKLMRRAHLEYIYLDYLNKNFAATFENDYPNESKYAPYLYAGMVFNVTMAWLDNGCKETIENLAQIIVNAIYSE